MKRDFKTKERDNDDLRRSGIDGGDRFFQGHGIKKLRDGGREPEQWMLNSTSLKEFLIARFPRAYKHCENCEGCSNVANFICEYHDHMCACRSCRQYSCAMMWTFAIYHCFRRGVSAETAAMLWNEMFDADHEEDSLNAIKPVTDDYFRRVIQQIELARKGQRLDGKPRSYGKPGRPRKNKLTPLQSTT